MSEATPVCWPVAGLRRAFARGELSPVEVASEALERIERYDRLFNGFLAVTPELALEQARAAEQAYRLGHDLPLLGVPVSIKDLFDVEGVVTTLGSARYRDSVAQADSVTVARLRRAGAVLVGKTNTAEFGQSATTDNQLGDHCRNPWDPARTAGGSSGGAAVSVAAGMSTVALGSDGGGSIRIPAAFCGLYGIKPTYGLVPGDLRFKAMTDFACPGPLARSVADARAFLEVIADTAFPRGPAPRGLRVAWCPAPEGRPVDRELLASVTAAVELLEDHGCVVEESELPIDDWNEAFSVLVLADEWRYRSHLLDGEADELSDYARQSIAAGARTTEEGVVRAREQLRANRERVAAFLERYDLIATPTTAIPAFPVGERPDTIDGVQVDRLWGPFPFTAPFNVSGCPAVSIPCGTVRGLPVGLQLVGAMESDGLLMDICEEIEADLGPFPHPELELPVP